MTLPKLLTSTTTIRFQDCDPFNHLNNGNYINYFINHREDRLSEDYDIDIYRMAKEIGKSWVSGSNQIAYLRPALTMEKVHIESQLIQYTDSELLVEMRMYNLEKTELKSVIWSSFVHFDLLKQRRTYHNADLMELFESVLSPLEETVFEERIKRIKAKMYHTIN